MENIIKFDKRRKYSRLTPEKKAGILAMFNAGISCTKVVTATNVALKDVGEVHKEFVQRNPDFMKPSAIARDERNLQIVEMRKSGATYAEIGEKFHMSGKNAWHICGMYGVSDPARHAREISGEVPPEIMEPMVEWLKKYATKEAADRMVEFVRGLIA